MATDTRTLATGNTTDDATFRAWGKSISDCIQAAALTKHTDTGQIDWTTVARPAINSYAGYEILKFTTDTASSLGCYIKLEYGQGSTLAYPALRIQVGTGTNGSGTLTGTTGTQRALVSTNIGISGTAYCSGGDGRFCFVGPWTAGDSNSASLRNTILIVERIRDSAGAPTANGIYTFFTATTSSSSACFAQSIRNGSAQTIVADQIGAKVPNQTTNFGGDYYLNTHHPYDQGFGNPIISNLFYFHTDLNAGTDITVPMYGTNRTYKPLGRNAVPATSWQSGAFGHTNSGFAILWE